MNRRKRAEFTKKVKTTAWDRADGHCEKCKAPLRPGHIHYDHVIPTAIRADNSLANCNVLCTACHGAKTNLDRRIIAKAHRLEEKHTGMKEKKSKGWQSKYKRKMDGTVVLRETGEPV